jgi:glycosyltransferase involved in cell wall biosynthesis
MYKTKKIGVIIRAYNEELFITSVLKSIPGFVDNIYVVNDASSDNTLEIITNLSKQDHRIIPVNRQKRGGAGAAAISGHKKALEVDNAILVMLDGDGQMDSTLLNNFLDPLVSDKADYVKGNRLSCSEDMTEMPVWRAFGNSLLTNLTRIASGYWHISDPQNGYTAISVGTLKKLELDKIESGFAFENDMLVKLNVVGARVMDVRHKAIYRGQSSKISYSKFIFSTSWVLLRDCFWRFWVKYILKKHIL